MTDEGFGSFGDGDGGDDGALGTDLPALDTPAVDHSLDPLGARIEVVPTQIGANIYSNGHLEGFMSPGRTGGVDIQNLGSVSADPGGALLGSIGTDMDPSTLTTDPDEIGTPDADAVVWEPQTTNFTCGIQSVGNVIRSMTGEDFSEAQLTYEATANGWLSEQGMTLDDISNLLEKHGVQNHVVREGSPEEMIAELDQGHKVIAAVDSGELWQGLPESDPLGGNADHALVITGIRVGEDGPVVVVNDSGIADGAAKEYPLEEFMESWKDSRFSYVVTDDVASPVDPTGAGDTGLPAEGGVLMGRDDFFRSI